MLCLLCRNNLGVATCLILEKQQHLKAHVNKKIDTPEGTNMTHTHMCVRAHACAPLRREPRLLERHRVVCLAVPESLLAALYVRKDVCVCVCVRVAQAVLVCST